MRKILLIAFLFTGTFTIAQQGSIISAAKIVTTGGGLISDSATQLRSEIADTAASLKSLPAYSFRVNNTNATASWTADNFRYVGETALSAADTVTWSAVTAPSGGTSNTYRWSQFGNRVWVDITLSNTTNGAAVTAVVVKLPASLPTPSEPTGQTGAGQAMFAVNAVFVSQTNVPLSAAARGTIRNNSVNNAYELAVSFSSIAPCTGLFSFTYTTN